MLEVNFWHLRLRYNCLIEDVLMLTVMLSQISCQNQHVKIWNNLNKTYLQSSKQAWFPGVTITLEDQFEIVVDTSGKLLLKCHVHSVHTGRQGGRRGDVRTPVSQLLQGREHDAGWRSPLDNHEFVNFCIARQVRLFFVIGVWMRLKFVWGLSVLIRPYKA